MLAWLVVSSLVNVTAARFFEFVTFMVMIVVSFNYGFRPAIRVYDRFGT